METTFLDKILQVLAKTRDALLKDLENEFRFVREGLMKLEGNGNKVDLSEAYLQCTEIVNGLFAKIGYDISDLDNKENQSAQKLHELILGILNLTDGVVDELSKLENAQGTEVVARVIPTILDLAKQMVDLMKQFSQIEIDQVFEQLDGKLNNNVFTKEFAFRVLDHIVITLLKNIQEVFQDEIEYIRYAISYGVEALEKGVQEVTDFVEDAVEDHAELLKTELSHAFSELQRIQKSVSKNVKEDVKSSLATLEGDITKKLAFVDDNVYAKISKAFACTYAILDFMGVIGEEKIELKFPSTLVDALKKAHENFKEITQDVTEKVDDALQKGTDVLQSVSDEANKAIGELNTVFQRADLDCRISSEVMDVSPLSLAGFTKVTESYTNKVGAGLNEMEKFRYPITIKVIRWSRFEELFTDPISYFKELYPVDDKEDVEDVMSRLVDVIRVFNPEMPDFSSLKNMLLTLLKRLESRVLTAAKDTFKEVWTKLQPVITVIRKIIDMLTELGRAFKHEISAFLTTLQTKMADFVNAVERKVSNKLEDASDEVKKLVNSLPEIKKIPIKDEGVRKLLNKVLLPAVVETLAKSDDLKGLSKEDICTCFKDNVNSIQECFQQWEEETNDSLYSFFSLSEWEKRMATTAALLEAEFNTDMKSITGLVSKDGLQRLVTDFDGTISGIADECDITDYVTIVQTAVNDITFPDPKAYYTSFCTTMKAGLTEFKNALSAKCDQFTDVDWEQLLKNILIAVWDKFKKKIILPVINPLKDMVLDIIRDIVSDIIRKLIEGIKQGADYVETIGMETYKELSAIKNNIGQDSLRLKVVDTEVMIVGQKYVDWALAVIEPAVNFAVSNKGVGDLIELIKNLFNTIPDDVKKDFSNLFPSVPDCLSEFAKTIDCKYDLDNKFLCVTLLNLKTNEDNVKEKGGSVNDSVDFDANLLLQICIFVGDYKVEVQENSETEEVEMPALFCMLVFRCGTSLTFDLGKLHEMTLSVSGGTSTAGVDTGKEKIDWEEEKKKLSEGVGFCITRKNKANLDEAMKIDDGIEFHGLFNADALNVMFLMSFSRKEENVWEVFDTKLLKMEVKNYPQYFYIGYDKNFPKNKKGDVVISDEGFEENKFLVGYKAALEGVKLTLKLMDNDFFKQVLKDNIEFGFDTWLWYDYQKGFDFGGGIRLKLDFDLNKKKIGPVAFDKFTVEAGPSEVQDHTVTFDVATTFNADLDGICISFDNLGVGFNVNYLDENGGIGDFDFSPHLNFPKGIGITVDTDVVKGGGFVNYDKEKDEFLGVLELSVIKKFSVSGFLLCNMGTKEGEHFSLITLISVSFQPGIPLGMGFSLTGLGGAVGLNRGISRESVTKGVREGSLRSVFFVKDIADHLDEMKNNIVAYFPEKKGQFYLGFLGQISFEPILKVDFGLLMQMPKPFEIIIVGALSVVTPGGLDDIISINVYFAGGINFSEGLWFDASLVNSHLVGIDLYGDMAFRLFWGGVCKGFLLSIGGFHPAYMPEEGMMVSNMRRLGMKLDYKILRISLETYLAITSNTFQIGARMDLLIGWKQFGISGYAGFNCLFQFDPFAFMFDVCAGVAVMLGKLKLLSIDLALDVSGPAPWHVGGSAKFWIIFPIEVDFSLTWGSRAGLLPTKTIEVVNSVFLPEFEKETNWSVKNNELMEDLVGLIESDSSKDARQAMLLQPYGQVSFNQSAVPFQTIEREKSRSLKKLEICNNARPTDIVHMKVDAVLLNGNKVPVTDEKNDFAPALYKAMTIEEKLKSPSYLLWNSGFTVDLIDGFKAGGVVEELDLTPQISVRNESPKVVPSFTSKMDALAPVCPMDNQDESKGRRVNYTKRNRASMDRYIAMLDRRQAKNMESLIEDL